MAMYIGKNWDDVTRELIRRACLAEKLPDGAEFQLRQFLEDGIVVIAYHRNGSSRGARGGTTGFYEVRLTDSDIAVRQLNNLGPINAAAV